jgi:hypothetical protein
VGAVGNKLQHETTRLSEFRSGIDLADHFRLLKPIQDRVYPCDLVTNVHHIPVFGSIFRVPSEVSRLQRLDRAVATKELGKPFASVRRQLVLPFSDN